jgi:hypothetical protein
MSLSKRSCDLMSNDVDPSESLHMDVPKEFHSEEASRSTRPSDSPRSCRRASVPTLPTPGLAKVLGVKRPLHRMMSQRDDLLKVDESRYVYRGYFPRYQRRNIKDREDLERRLEAFRQNIANAAGRGREMMEMNDSFAETGSSACFGDTSTSLGTA